MTFLKVIEDIDLDPIAAIQALSYLRLLATASKETLTLAQ